MNRSELIQLFAQRTDLSHEEADWMIRLFFEALAQGLQEDGRVELRGFGVFRLSERNQAGFTNPKDGRYYGGTPIKTIKFYRSEAGEEKDER